MLQQIRGISGVERLHQSDQLRTVLGVHGFQDRRDIVVIKRICTLFGWRCALVDLVKHLRSPALRVHLRFGPLPIQLAAHTRLQLP